MGFRGPVPAPDNVRALRGAKPLRRDGVKVRRLVLPPKAPTAPAGLGKMAAAEWRRVTRELGNAGVLADVDRAIVTAYCTAWEQMMLAYRALQKNGGGFMPPDSNNRTAKHPAWQVYRESLNAVIAAGSQLYVTPVARLRLPIAPGAAGIGGRSDSGDDDTFD